MRVLCEYIFNRPISGLIQSTILGLLLPFTLASLLKQRAGRPVAIVLAPVWLVLILVTIPAGILFCIVMVMAKGPLWQYPPEKRVGEAPLTESDRKSDLSSS